MSEIIPPLPSAPDLYRPPIEVFVVQPRKQRYWLHGLLLLATFFTTLVVGARMQYSFDHNQPVFSFGDDALGLFPVKWAFSQASNLALGVPFAATLMLILLAHEMGHYLYCRYYGVSATLPFFIPAPTLIGTLGAFIRIRSPIRSRSALFDIGIAGPIAGFVIALPVLIFSLARCKPTMAGTPAPDITLNFPLIFLLAQKLLSLLAPAGVIASVPLSRIALSPVAVAAWVGMFATSLNLLPGGQLDGGHIVFSIVPGAHSWVSRLTIFALIPLALYSWAGWLIWAILLRISGMRHPQVPPWPGVSGGRQWLGLLALIMLILTLTPAPFGHSSLLDVIREFRSGG